MKSFDCKELQCTDTDTSSHTHILQQKSIGNLQYVPYLILLTWIANVDFYYHCIEPQVLEDSVLIN